jgi:hypothetical protein
VQSVLANIARTHTKAEVNVKLPLKTKFAIFVPKRMFLTFFLIIPNNRISTSKKKPLYIKKNKNSHV